MTAIPNNNNNNNSFPSTHSQTSGFSASSIHQAPSACPGVGGTVLHHPNRQDHHVDPSGSAAVMLASNNNHYNNNNTTSIPNTTSNITTTSPGTLLGRSHSRSESYGGEGSSYTSSSYDREYNEQYYYQQMMDDAAHYAELQRQDEEYERQLAELDVTLPQNTQCAPFPGLCQTAAAPVYYQQPKQQHPAEEQQAQQQQEQDEEEVPQEEVVPRLPHIISWADDSDEAVDRAEQSNSSDSPPEGDADYFNISSTSDSLHANGSSSSGSAHFGISPMKGTGGSSNGSFGGLLLSGCATSAAPALNLNDIPPSPPVASGSVENAPVQDFSCPPTPTPSVCVSYCSGMPMQYHDFLDLEEQRALVADHQWRFHTTWCERLNEASRLSVLNRTVSLKVLVNEAYRLDKKHLQAKGASPTELENLKRIWTSIGEEMVQEMDDPAAAIMEGGLAVSSPNQQSPQATQQFDNSSAVLRKFSAMAIFINGSSTGSRSYGENEEGRYNRQEQQEKCLDALAYSGRLFF